MQDLDELISADLDGELATYATEHMVSEEGLRAEMQADPQYAKRLEILKNARDAARSQTSGLDDLERKRLVRVAMGQSESDATQPTWIVKQKWLLSGAAAVVILILGGAFLVANNHGSQTVTGSAKALSNSPASGSQTFGDITDPQTFRKALVPYSNAIADLSGTAGAERTASPKTPSATNADKKACATNLATTQNSTFQFESTATYKKHEVLVVGLTNGKQNVAYVLKPDTCEILTSQTF